MDAVHSDSAPRSSPNRSTTPSDPSEDESDAERDSPGHRIDRECPAMSLAKSALARSLRIAAMAGGVLKEEAKRLARGQTLDVARLKQAAVIVEELGRLKGTAMKFGQMLALEGRDFLPAEVIAILEKLQNQSNFLALPEIEAILRAELGVEKFDLLTALSPTPIAAASIGQVHRARFEGSDIALKIQYPGVKNTVDSDLKILRMFVERVTPLFLDVRADYSDLFTELREVFGNETSYLREAAMTERYAEHARSLPGVRVPRVHRALTTDRVLGLGFESGETISAALRSPLFTRDLRKEFADLLIRLYVTELSEWGLVQTDPNLGNFLVDLDRRELVLLDFGAAREYSADFRRKYTALVRAAVDDDRAACIERAISLGVLDPREDESARDALYRLLKESMRPFRADAFDFDRDDFSKTMRDLGLDLIRKLRHTPPPRELIFLHRKLGGLFQIIRRLGVPVDLRPHLERMLDSR